MNIIEEVRERTFINEVNPKEKSDIETVLALGQIHGYGNMMAWLATAWNISMWIKNGIELGDVTREPYSFKK